MTDSDAKMAVPLLRAKPPQPARVSAAAAGRRRPVRGARRGPALLAAAVILLTTAVAAATIGTGSLPTLPAAIDDLRADRIVWKTDVVDFRAADLWIDAGGRRFTAAGPTLRVSSDPGDATYRTLEIDWGEHGVEMRLYLYFGGDDATWWVDEVRTYDGAAHAEWVFAYGPMFRTANGGTWSGDVDLDLSRPGVDGARTSLHIRDLRLATRPSDLVMIPPGGGISLPEQAQPFARGGPLHCSGILQMSPAAAEHALLALGYRLSWRLETTTGPNSGYSDPRKRAPDGIIVDEPSAGTSGELIMFVAPLGDPRAIAVPFPDDCSAP